MAARNGQSIHNMPREYRGTSDEFQWKEAFRREQEGMEQTAEQTALAEHEAEIDAVRTSIETLKSMEDLKECLRLILCLIEERP